MIWIYSQKVGNGKSFSSSPVAADGVIYIAGNDGTVYSVKAGPELQVVAENKLHEKIMTTPAISTGYIFFRTQNHLLAISGE